MGNEPLIDVHVHLYPDAETGQRAKASYQIWEYGTDPGIHFDTASGVLEEVGDRYEKAGFDHAVVLQLFDVAAERTDAIARLEPGLPREQVNESEALLDEQLAVALMEANRWVVDAAASHPLLTAYVGIDPCLLPADRIVPHLSEMAAKGARGVKLHPVAQGCKPSDPRLDSLYELCCELDLVVLSHSGPGHREGATARPRDFSPVLERWPALKLVLAHLGGASFQEAAALAEDYPQVNFDLSEIIEWMGAENAPSVNELSMLIRRIGADRVMLGSDFPWYEPARTAEKVVALPGLGVEEQAALLGGSAVRHLHLELART